VFQLDNWKQLDRFLVLGSVGGTYYVGERALTKENAGNIMKCIAEDGPRFVSRIIAVSDGGLAPKNDPALFALALAITHGNEATKKAAFEAIPKIARIGTHLFHLVDMLDDMRGWGSGLRKAIGRWYTGQDPSRLAYQLIKYQQRDGWSHRDILRLTHPKYTTQTQGALFAWATGGIEAFDGDDGERVVDRRERGVSRYDKQHRVLLPEIVEAFEYVKATRDENIVIDLIRKYRLPRECIPTEMLNSKGVWEALLEEMPMTAMLRNLGKMTSIELLTDNSEATTRVVSMLENEEAIKAARIHPIAILIASGPYGRGHGMKGGLSWSPARRIVNALENAFYLSFKNIEPTGKRIFIGLDVSGSMGFVTDFGVSVRELAAAMAMATVRAETDVRVVGFSHRLVDISLKPSDTLSDVCKRTEAIPMGGTDCALPMIHAQEKRIDADAFIVYTDNETWYGKIHPFQALREYRQKTGIDAKLIVVGMTSTNFTIADPSDAGMLDVVGFDSSAPAVMSAFIAGKI
jgi:60 kDa SS-A/Ro ribonucleoprotein